MMTKIFYLYDRSFDSNRNLTTEHVKVVKIPFFFEISQIPGFSRLFLPKL